MSEVDRPTINIDLDFRHFFAETLPSIIDSITGEEQPVWGIMTVHHMLEHMEFTLSFVTGEFVPPLYTPAEKLERFRAFLKSNFPLMQNFKFPLLPLEEVKPLETASLQEAKQQLKDKISQFLHVIDDPSFTTMLHPFFGDLDKEEWLLFQYKHFYHHLSQFGLMPSI